MSSAQWGVTVALLCALLLTSWLQRQLELDKQQSTAQGTPDYYLEDFRSVAYNSEGVPTTWLEAAQLAHYPGDGSFHLRKPQIRWQNPAQAPWEVVAATGWANAEGTEVTLQGQVVLERLPQNKADAPFSLSTEQLRLWPKEERLETDQAVVLQQGASHRIAAVGLRAALRKPAHIEFLSQVSSQHVAN